MLLNSDIRNGIPYGGAQHTMDSSCERNHEGDTKMLTHGADSLLRTAVHISYELRYVVLPAILTRQARFIRFLLFYTNIAVP